MHIAITRPREDSERTAALLRAQGHRVLLAPLLRVEPVTTALRANWGAVIITSAHAAAAMASHPALKELTRLPLFAVGQRSAEAARAIGFTQVTAAGGDLRDLTRTIAAARSDAKAPLLYLAGEDRAGDLIGDLAVHGIAAELAVVYRAVVAPFAPALTEALRAGEIDAVLHYSKRSAESFLSGAADAGVAGQALAAKHLCLSAQVAEPLIAAGARRVDVAARPDEAALIELLPPRER
ncbi:MAG: uroporphyrinogen-III synthase [Pseudolabrys sp.]|nr:uroporphyrinogen-III synthase [Pseudolabrys sp.]